MSDLVDPRHLEVMRTMLAREMPRRIPTQWDVEDLAVCALLVAQELNTHPKHRPKAQVVADAPWLLAKDSKPMNEVRARRQLETARETLVHERRNRGALSAISVAAVVVVASGIVLTAYASWPFVFVSIVAFIVGVVTTSAAFVVNAEKVGPARKELRKAEWAYEDAILGGAS